MNIPVVAMTCRFDPTSSKSSDNKRNLIKIPLSRRQNQDVSFGVFNAHSVGPRLRRAEISVFIVDQDLDFIFLTETWLKPAGDEHKVKDMTPPGYVARSFPRSSWGGGIAVIYKDIFSSYVSFNSSFDFDHSSFELFHIKLSLSQRCFHFFCVYRPPPSSTNNLTATMFTDQLPDLLELINSLSGDVIIVGDLNCHFDMPSSYQTPIKKVLDLLYTFNLTQVIDKPTHDKGRTLDIIIVRSDSNYLTSHSVSDSLASDHFCVMGRLDVTRPTRKRTVRTTRKLKGIDRSTFKADLSQELLAIPNMSADALDSCLRSVLDHHAPAVKRIVPQHKSSPWYSDVAETLRDAKQKRRQAERQWRSTRLTVHKQIFDSAKKAVSEIVCTAKSTFYNAKIAASSSSKELYAITNDLLAKVKSSPLPSVYPQSELPALFSTYFTEKVDTIRAGLDAQYPLSSDVIPNEEVSLFQGQRLSVFHPVSEDEVRNVIKNMNSKSCEIDPVPTSLLLECLDSLLPAITQIINDSLSSGIFPDIYKKAIVKPLLKKASLDQNNLKNYRPVSNLMFLSKLIEKVVLGQLLDHLATNNLMDTFQSAYRSCHSTETALLRILNDLLLATDKGQVSVLALLDLSSAFDTIDHAILIKRLQNVFGINGIALLWFSSYLSHRSQSVLVCEQYSDPSALRCGVPQGSVLGPVLFLLYMKPLSDIIAKHYVQHHGYSDDTQMYKSGNVDQVNEVVQCMTRCILDVRSWMFENRLKLNEEKTEAMIVCSPYISRSLRPPQSLVIDNTAISFSKSVKNLGVTIQSDLSMAANVTNTCRLAYIELRRISSIRHLLTTDSAKTLVCSLILSRLDYANSLLSGCPKTLVQRLQRVQNDAARLVVQVRRSAHTTPILRQLHWLPVEDRILYKTLSVCYVSLSESGPTYLKELLHWHVPGRDLRSSSDTKILQIPGPTKVKTKTFGERSFTFQGPTYWNELPQSLRYTQSKTCFKSGLKTHLFKSRL